MVYEYRGKGSQVTTMGERNIKCFQVYQALMISMRADFSSQAITQRANVLSYEPHHVLKLYSAFHASYQTLSLMPIPGSLLKQGVQPR